MGLNKLLIRIKNKLANFLLLYLEFRSLKIHSLYPLEHFYSPIISVGDIENGAEYTPDITRYLSDGQSMNNLLVKKEAKEISSRYLKNKFLYQVFSKFRSASTWMTGLDSCLLKTYKIIIGINQNEDLCNRYKRI